MSRERPGLTAQVLPPLNDSALAAVLLVQDILPERLFSVIQFDLKRSGMVFIFSAPSGGGKSTIIRALISADPTLTYSVSATTRPPRGEEVHAKDYYFYSVKEFEKLIAEDQFYEFAKVHGNYYGTLKSEVKEKLDRGLNVILDIDVQGSMNLMKTIPESTSIFFLPPSMATLEKRLRARGTDCEEVILQRLENASGEIKFADQYDYVFINWDLDETIADVQKVIEAQYFRACRLTIRDASGEVLVSNED